MIPIKDKYENKEVLQIPKNSITGASPSDC